MSYNEPTFLTAIEQSFAAYIARGARSTAKLKPLHKFVAETLKGVWGDGFTIKYLGDDTREEQVGGKYYPKNIDVTVLDGSTPVFCLGIKFVTSNYKQNGNNYFENMMGETANIQALGDLPYAQFIIFRRETPYYAKDGTLSKIERINDKDISKYLKLSFDTKQAHRPLFLCVEIVDINEKTGTVSRADLSGSFLPKTADLLRNVLAPNIFFKNISDYKDFYLSQK